MKSKPIICKLNGIQGGYIVIEAKNRHLAHIFMNFLNDIWSLNLNFNSATSLMKECNLVYLNESSWANSTYSWYYYFKKYICCHIVVLAVNVNLVNIPAELRDTVVGQNTKRGKKKES